MKRSKIIILLITLTLPVILYLFLRSFGQNEFALPVFFDDKEKLYCSDSTVGPEDIQVFSLTEEDSFKLSDIYEGDYKIIHLPNLKDSEIQTLKNELNRVFNTFDDLSLNILSFMAKGSNVDNAIGRKVFLPEERAESYLYPSVDLNKIVDCIYAFPTSEWDGKHPSEETIPIDHTLVLLDDENRIRGYYDGYETKEVDRLILEIRVLLSNK